MAADSVAIALGYTKAVVAYEAGTELNLLIKPDTDYDTTFKAWCLDEHEFLSVNGYMFTIESPLDND